MGRHLKWATKNKSRAFWPKVLTSQRLWVNLATFSWLIVVQCNPFSRVSSSFIGLRGAGDFVNNNLEKWVKKLIAKQDRYTSGSGTLRERSRLNNMQTRGVLLKHVTLRWPTPYSHVFPIIPAPHSFLPDQNRDTSAIKSRNATSSLAALRATCG